MGSGRLGVINDQFVAQLKLPAAQIELKVQLAQLLTGNGGDELVERICIRIDRIDPEPLP
jgi:hypothetical protein